MPSVDTLINEGITALKEGRKDDARRLLMQAVDLDEHNEKGWLFLSGCVETLEEQQVCLENVLSINPQNQKAQKGLETVKAKIANSSPSGGKPAAPPADAPASSATDSVGSARSALGPGWEDYAPPSGSASSVDWAHGSAPAHGSGKDVQLPTPEEYDNWVTGLSLGGNAPPDTGPGGFDSGPDTSGFGSFDPSSGPFAAPSSSFDDNPDPFGTGSKSGPFQKGKSPPPSPTSANVSSPAAPPDPFGGSASGGFGDSAAPTFESGPFGASEPAADTGFATDSGDPFGSASTPSAAPLPSVSGGKDADPFASFDPFSEIASHDSADAYTPPAASGGFDDPDLFGGVFSPPSSSKKPDPFGDSDPLFKTGTRKDKAGQPSGSLSSSQADLAEVDAILGGSGSTAFSFGSKSPSVSSANRGLYKDIPDDIQVKVSRSKGGKTDLRLSLSVIVLLVLNAVSLAVLFLNFMKK